jgi:hypothetical protein
MLFCFVDRREPSFVAVDDAEDTDDVFVHIQNEMDIMFATKDF